MKIKFIILVVFLPTVYTFSQNSLDLIYVCDKQSERNQIQSKVEEIIGTTTLDDLCMYVSYINQDVVQIRKNQDLSNLISQSSIHDVSYNQLLKLNQFFLENEYFENLESVNFKDVLKEKIHLHFFFNLEDFFVYNEIETVLESLLHINRLLLYSEGKKIINKNCNVSIYLRGKEFLESNEFVNNYQSQYNYHHLKILFLNNYLYHQKLKQN